MISFSLLFLQERGGSITQWLPLLILAAIVGGIHLLRQTKNKQQIAERANERSALNSELVCYNCKTDLEEDAKFCASCQSPVAKGGLIECPSCKELVSVGANFCKHCATEITPKTKVQSISSVTSYAGNSVSSSKRAKSNTLAPSGAILATISGVAFFWGVNYTSDWSNRLNAGFGSLVNGQTDSTYQLAQACVVLGAIGFLVGVILFIVGLTQQR